MCPFSLSYFIIIILKDIYQVYYFLRPSPTFLEDLSSAESLIIILIRLNYFEITLKSLSMSIISLEGIFPSILLHRLSLVFLEDLRSADFLLIQFQ